MRVKKIYVVDSSVAVKWLNSQSEKYTNQSDKILKDVQENKSCIMMPELAKYEVGNALFNKQASLQNTIASLGT